MVVYRVRVVEGVDEERVVVVLVGTCLFRLGGRVEQQCLAWLLGEIWTWWTMAHPCV